MYDLNSYSFGKRIRDIRLSKKMSLKEVGDLIGKTKATISKYENGIIILDLMTTMEICNALNITINELCIDEEEVDFDNNPFDTEKLFMYYISFDGLVVSKLEISGNGRYQNIILKNAIKDATNEFAYEYIGKMEYENNVAFINLSNSNSNSKFEKVEIIIDLNSLEDDIYKGCILGTTDSNLPTIRKCIVTKRNKISKKILNEFYEGLKITEEETEKMLKDKYWNIETKKLDDFFVSIR